jgi:hypothetical protein
MASSSSSSSSPELTSLVNGVGITDVLTAGGGLVFLFLFLFFFFAVFTAATLAAAVKADCFTAAALVLRLGFMAPFASEPVLVTPPTSRSVSSSASTDESDS